MAFYDMFDDIGYYLLALVVVAITTLAMRRFMLSDAAPTKETVAAVIAFLVIDAAVIGIIYLFQAMGPAPARNGPRLVCKCGRYGQAVPAINGACDFCGWPQ